MRVNYKKLEIIYSLLMCAILILKFLICFEQAENFKKYAE